MWYGASNVFNRNGDRNLIEDWVTVIGGAAFYSLLFHSIMYWLRALSTIYARLISLIFNSHLINCRLIKTKVSDMWSPRWLDRNLKPHCCWFHKWLLVGKPSVLDVEWHWFFLLHYPGYMCLGFIDWFEFVTRRRQHWNRDNCRLEKDSWKWFVLHRMSYSK